MANLSPMPTSEPRPESRWRTCSGKTARPCRSYQVYVHYYKKHKKRRSKDPTKFQVIINQGGDMREYNGELTAGDPSCSWRNSIPRLRSGPPRRELELNASSRNGRTRDTGAIAEVEENRQAEIEAAEAERLAEIEAAREQEVLEAKEAAQRAMSELQARLEREGAQSSDVQISLMWNNTTILIFTSYVRRASAFTAETRPALWWGMDVDANVRAEHASPSKTCSEEARHPQAPTKSTFTTKKHQKRKSKDPTKFQVIVTPGGSPWSTTANCQPATRSCWWLNSPPVARGARGPQART